MAVAPAAPMERYTAARGVQDASREAPDTQALSRDEAIMLLSPAGAGVRTRAEWGQTSRMIAIIVAIFLATTAVAVGICLSGAGGLAVSDSELFTTTWISVHSTGALVFALASAVSLIAGQANSSPERPAQAAAKVRTSVALAALMFVIAVHDIVLAAGIVNASTDAFGVLDVPYR